MPAAAHSRRECGRAMARRRRLNAYLRYPVAPTCWCGVDVTRGGCDPIFDCRETAMGPSSCHFETLRRAQTVGDRPERTVSEAYPCTTSTCHTPCMHAPQRLCVELEQRISTHEETLGKAVRNAARCINANTIRQLSGSGDRGETGTTNASELRVHASTQWQGLWT